MPASSAKSAILSLLPTVLQPKAHGSGITCAISLAEPNVFLSGFDYDDDGTHRGDGPAAALMRGTFQMSVSKDVRIKAIDLKLISRAQIYWPMGVDESPRTEILKGENLASQNITFFNALSGTCQAEYGNQCVYRLNEGPGGSTSPEPGPHISNSLHKRFSLQSEKLYSCMQCHSPGQAVTRAKDFTIFRPGTYCYSFELPIDQDTIETVNVQNASVKWELQAVVDRAGILTPSIVCSREVSIIRLPDPMSLRTSEPICINRSWEGQLRFATIISGKSFAIGSKIPIAVQLTPLAKIRVHKIQVYLTESVQYWTKDRTGVRLDPSRKLMLFEKVAGEPVDPLWASSDLKTVIGGEGSVTERRKTRELARQMPASQGTQTLKPPEHLLNATANLLGDLDLGLESLWGPTELEGSIQIPTCEMMKRCRTLRLHPDCSWDRVNVHHWLEILITVSPPSQDNAADGKQNTKMKACSPVAILNCRASHSNTNLPAYSGSAVSHHWPLEPGCGCSGAETASLTPPMSDAGAANTMIDSRPIHCPQAPASGFSLPSFGDDYVSPPEFDEQSPRYETNQSVLSLPPQYDTSKDGLRDYFVRLTSHGYRDTEASHLELDGTSVRMLDQSGRANMPHPRAPGERMSSRSLDIPHALQSIDTGSTAHNL